MPATATLDTRYPIRIDDGDISDEIRRVADDIDDGTITLEIDHEDSTVCRLREIVEQPPIVTPVAQSHRSRRSTP